MLALITRLDGVNALLFHVEQWGGGRWQWRSRPQLEGAEWSAPESADQESVSFPLTDPHHAVQVEWREEDGEWQAAHPHVFGVAECEFVVGVKSHFDQTRDAAFEAKACAAVRGHPSGWRLDLPRRVLAADGPETLRVRGVSVCPGIGQLLREDGEFQCGDGNFSVMNAGPSQAALLPVSMATPEVLPYTGAFFVKTGRLAEAEIQLLKTEIASWQD